MVSTHAQTISRALPHRTALRRWVEPTPAMAPAIAWVVDTGSPRYVGKRMEIAAPVSAQKSSAGVSAASGPSHRLDDFPPAGDGAEADGNTGANNHPGLDVTACLQPGGDEERGDDAIVFWPSFVPCAQLKRAEDTSAFGERIYRTWLAACAGKSSGRSASEARKGPCRSGARAQ